MELSDSTILYQLEKVDQGGAVSDLVEDRMHELSEIWGYPIEDNEENPHYGDMQLPDGRYVMWTLDFIIVDPREEEHGNKVSRKRTGIYAKLSRRAHELVRTVVRT